MKEIEYGNARVSPFSRVSARLRLLKRVLKYCGSRGGWLSSIGAYQRLPIRTHVPSAMFGLPFTPTSALAVMIWSGSAG